MPAPDNFDHANKTDMYGYITDMYGYIKEGLCRGIIRSCYGLSNSALHIYSTQYSLFPNAPSLFHLGFKNS